ncbi:cytosolic endo-beta-N-acetylglucosaminidase isoform X2 [Rhagoletis pomonella]|uniref:cytosolic endo-beta-N-acetylglucosaminidase isoform X2 n=1 Tax=Rhagoletis pomonella TaxID=28610 RepID=UPI0017821764|nr:cytosolic endo-beta-N-acetylglucosaminidase isoform X2 [Rhagoletis pomonella]
MKTCDGSEECCNQLEAEAIHSNEQLLSFELRSKDIQWQKYVAPLTPRIAPVYLQRQFQLLSNYREPIGNHNRREVLVCHDMMGNYLEDRHFHSSKKYDDYRFYHWAGIDYFCYFSHNYITIPPCGWLNAAHKHGVRVLGTFITESGHASLLNEVLQSTDMVDKIVDAMVKLCKHYCFEGWLINVECRVKPENMENLHYLVERLRNSVEKEVDHGVVFWYDSIIDTGELRWQNEINAKNVRFFHTAHGMLINYTWNDKSLEMTTEICERSQSQCQRAFFGIDVFGRGQVAKFQSKQTLARIVSHRFSTGIFAPAWTYETLQMFGYNIKQPLGDDSVNDAFLRRNEKFWCSLWEHIATHPYSILPFYSDFCLGSGKRTYLNGRSKSSGSGSGGGDGEQFFNLSQCSLQPSVPLYQLAERFYADGFNGGSCLRILQYNNSFRVFVSDFRLQSGGLVFAYAYKLHPNDGEFDCILRFCTRNNARDCYLFMGDYYNTTNLQKGRCYVSPIKSKYNDLLARNTLDTPKIPKEFSLPENAPNGWRVRYYVVAFDGAIQVKDIGVLYRRSTEATDTAYLGAVYLNECDVNTLEFPQDSNIALIQIYGEDLLN